MTIDDAIERYSHNAEYERVNGNLQGCLEFKQLVDWLKDYKRLLEQNPCEEAISRQAVLDILDYWYDSDSSEYVQAARSICDLPSVNPREPKFIVHADGKIEQIKEAVAKWKPRLELDPNPKTDVLDEIRAEIANIEIYGQTDHACFIKTGEQVKNAALQIVDKYR